MNVDKTVDNIKEPLIAFAGYYNSIIIKLIF